MLFSRRSIPQLFFASLQPGRLQFAKCLGSILHFLSLPGFPLQILEFHIIHPSLVCKFLLLFFLIVGEFYEGWRAPHLLRKSWDPNLPPLQEPRGLPPLIERDLYQIAWKKFLEPSHPAWVLTKGLHLHYLHLKLFFLCLLFSA